MERRLGSLSIRWKLALVTAMATVVALIVTGVIAAIYDVQTYREQKVQEVKGEAQILASSAIAPLVFDDEEAMADVLRALAANDTVRAAAIYNRENSPVARYQREDVQRPELIAQTPGPAGFRFGRRHLDYFLPVMQGDVLIGTLYINVDTESAARRISRMAGIMVLVGTAVLIVVLPASARLHGIISNPLEELAGKNAIIEATFSSVDHGVMVVDPQFQIMLANERVCEIFFVSGVGSPATVADLIGRPLDDIIATRRAGIGLTPEAIREEMRSYRSREKHRGGFTLSDGRTIEYRHAPLPEGGFVRTYTDITEEQKIQDDLRRARESAESAVRAKSQFLAAMSHEIRTPMNGVIGIVELLQSTRLSDEQGQLVDVIRQSGTSLLDVINDILDYSKIEAGRMTVEQVPFALAEVVETTAMTVGGQSRSKTLNVFCRVDPQIDWKVTGDPVRIRQIVLNLLSNAMKFTEEGSVGISAFRVGEDTDTLRVRFEVSDTGIGIAEDQKSQLFQPFGQVDYSTTRRFGGTGLGLSISHNLVDLMGGEMGVESTLGEGSVFWFEVSFGRLPAVERDSPFAGYHKVLQNLRVAVCDKVRPQSEVAEYLAAVGVDAMETHNVGELVDRLKRETSDGAPVDIVVLRDRQGEDGAALLAERLEENRDIAQTRVLFAIAHTSVSAEAHVPAMPSKSRTVSSPIARGRLYEAMALLAGRKPVGRDQEEDKGVQSYTAPTVEEAVAAGCLILVAEDNRTNQFVVRRQLARLGYAAEFVADGGEAWALFTQNENRYGLLITDCHMPYIDGYELTGRIRDREMISGRHLPIVALTANALEGEREVCLTAGMDDYLYKPTSLARLDATVRKWLPKAAGLRQAEVSAGAPAPNVDSATGGVSGPAPPIDMAGLADILGSDAPEDLAALLDMYEDSIAETAVDLHARYQARDVEAMVGAAHAAKGAAASAGADGLAELCKGMELAARKGDWDGIAPLLDDVDRTFRAIRDFISAYRQSS